MPCPHLPPPSHTQLCGALGHVTGHVCGEGATSPTEAVCGVEIDVFCPEGSSAPSKVSRERYFSKAEMQQLIKFLHHDGSAWVWAIGIRSTFDEARKIRVC